VDKYDAFTDAVVGTSPRSTQAVSASSAGVYGAISNLAWVVVLILMVWKPGL